MRPPLSEPIPQEPARGGLFSLLDAFIHGDNPVSEAVRTRIPLPILEAGQENLGKAWDLGGVGLNTALGRTSTPLSAGPVALEAAAKGAPIRQEDLDVYTAKAAANSPGGATGPVAPIMFGMYAAEKTWDYGVNRPIGTAALLSNTNSPLYNGKPIRAIDPETGQVIESKNTPGFQLTDITAAWNQTEKVSAGQALMASPVLDSLPFVGAGTTLFKQMGGLDKYDPWDDNDMSQAQNNPFYVFATGSTDFALQLVVPPMVRAGRLAAMRKMGLTNTVRSAEELAQFRADFEAHTPETPTAWGTIVDDVTNSSNPFYIRSSSVVANNVGANKGRLSDILAETTDRSTVNEILLANMGDAQAILNLADAAPDIVWRLSEADIIIQSNAVNGVKFRPTGPQLGKVNQVFDSALERNRYFGTLRDELIAPESVDELGNVVPAALRVNSTWRPTNSVIVEKVRKAGRDIGYAARSGDWTEAPQWIAQRFDGGRGAPVTSRVQWAGSRSPLGHVANNGARPEEKWMEYNAQLDSIPWMRGNRLVPYEGRMIPAYEWRQRTWQWLNSHDDAATPDAWAQMESAVIDMAADTYSVPREVAHKIADAYRRQIGDTITYLRESNGYLFDEFDGRIVIDPATLRQMLSSFQTLPMAEVIRTIRDDGNRFVDLAHGGQDLGIAIYDGVQKVFRTDVLFRPGYTGKNSILEPWISSFIAHGTILADEGLWATMGNFTANTVRRWKRVAYVSQLHKLIDSSLRTGAMKREAEDLVTLRHQTQQEIDEALSEIDSWNHPDTSPATRAMYEDEVRSLLVEAQFRLESIDKALDGLLPEWRQVVEPATQAEIRAKLREFKAIIGDDPEYVQVLESQAFRIERAARERVQSEKQVADARVSEYQLFLDGLLEKQRVLETESTGRDFVVPDRVELMDARGEWTAANTRLQDVRAKIAEEKATLKEYEGAMTDAEVKAANERINALEQERRDAWAARRDVEIRGFAMTGQREEVDLSGWGVAESGKPLRDAESPAAPGDQARMRDEQGRKLREQIAFAEERLAEAKAEAAGADPTVVPAYTALEQAELNRVYAILDRIDEYQNRAAGEMDPSVDPELLYGGSGPEWDTAGIVDVQRLLNMPGNATTGSWIGSFDRAAFDEPVVVAFDPARGRMYVEDGNHRVAAASEAGMQTLPTRVVRRNIDDAKVAEVEAEGGRVATVDVPESGLKDATGNDVWPQQMRPSFIGLGEDASGPMTYSAATRPAGDAELRAQVAELQAMYDDIVTQRQSFVPKETLTALQALEEKAAALDAQIGDVKGRLSTTEGRNARIGADLGSAGYRGSGAGMMDVYIGGERFEVPAAFSTREYMHGEGYRAEASAQRTNDVTFDPGRQSDYAKGRWRRSNGPDVLTPDSPLYWPQLAHVANRFFRSDLLVQKYMSGWSRERIAVWLASPEGQAYQARMGKDYLKRIESYDRISTQQVLPDDTPAPSGGPEITDIRGRTRSAGRAEPQAPGGPDRRFEGRDGATGRRPTHVLTSSTTELDTVLRLVDQYFPDKSVQKRVADGEVTAGELQEVMGARTDLSRIAGDDLNYHPSRAERARTAFTAALDKIWHWIATMPEDRLARWPFYVREFRNQITNRGKILQEQGVKMTDEQWGALRQASHRGSLTELEKTFYNIRRYNTPVYNSRFLMTFPGAFFNSIYRYGRFMVREPERMLQLGMLGADIIKWGAVDAEGNRVDDVRDAVYFLVPGTKTETSSGMKFPISSLATLTVNYPSLGIGMVSALTLLQARDAATASYIESKIGTTAYEELFPYGISNNPLSNVAGAYQKDLWRAVRGEDDVDVRRAVMSLYGYKMYQWEKNGMQGEQPSMQETIEEIQSYYASGAFKKFVSPFSIQTPVEGDLLDQAWSDIQSKHAGDTEAAREEFTDLYGDAARWLTMPTSERAAYIPPTMEAYDRIWKKYPDLARELVGIDPMNPEYVSLLAYGTDGEYSAEVSKYLQTNPLPGDDSPVAENLDPIEFESKMMQSEGWDQYSAGKARYDAEHLRLTTLRDAATSEFERQHYRDIINGLETDWDGWVTQLEEANLPWARQKNGSGEEVAKTATIYLQRIMQEPSLGKSPEFVKVSDFLAQRETAKAAYAAAPDDQKKALKAQFTDYVTKYFVEGDPTFGSLWNRYYASEWDIAND